MCNGTVFDGNKTTLKAELKKSIDYHKCKINDAIKEIKRLEDDIFIRNGKIEELRDQLIEVNNDNV